MKAIVNEIRDPTLRESVKDYLDSESCCAGTSSFAVRGICRANVSCKSIKDLRLTLSIAPENTTTKIKAPIGEAEMSENSYKPIFEALAERPHTVGELMELPAVKAVGNAEAPEVAGILIGSAQADIVSFPGRTSEVTERARRYNAALGRPGHRSCDQCPGRPGIIADRDRHA